MVPRSMLRPFAAVLCLPLLLAGCSTEETPPSAGESPGGPPISQRKEALTQAEIRTINFELLSDWQVWSGQGSIASSPLAIEGQSSLAVSGLGFAGVRNVTPLTKDDEQTPEVVGYDVWIPPNQVNPAWHGDTQLSIDAPSAGIHQQYLGYRALTDLPKGQWVRVEFPVPNWIRQALDSANYTDLRFVIAINAPTGSATHYLDRFTLGPVPTECTPLDDGNPCTSDECDPITGQTTHVPLAPDALCSDGNLCNGTEACDGAGTCVPGDAPDLDDGNPCTADSCDPDSGIHHSPLAMGTSCADGDLCNGEETCDGAGACQAGVPPDVDDGNPCTADTCDEAEGVSHAPVPSGTSCGDGDACNGAELCDGAGACQAGAPPAVDDGNPCTADACDPLSGVTHFPVSAGLSCSDGNACNGSEVCDGAGSCQAGTAPPLDDGNPCTDDVCDPIVGVTHIPVAPGVGCADGDACNGAEACDGAGACLPGTPVETDDGNACTLGSCDPATGVVTQIPAPVDSPCGDGNACNGSEFCDAGGACLAGTAPEIDDGNACTADSCDPLFGVDHTPVSSGTSCSDGDVCNGEEVCDGTGICGAGTPLVIDDGNDCTADSCDAVAGVTHTPLSDGSSCTDENACTTTDTCQAGVCEGSNPIVCGALDGCHDAGTCDPQSGLCSDPPKPDGSACDDGIACTSGDSCQAGICEGGDTPSLEDAPCQVATCDAETGGVEYSLAPVGSACQPDACSEGVCSAQGECLMTTSTVVDDGNPCTIDYCDPIIGPAHLECEEIDPTVATTVLSSTKWLFTGLFPVQTGVDPADIEERRAALITGKVTTRTGEPIPSVKVAVNGHPEFGETLTQVDGTFDMVVNGGGTLQVQFHKAGYLDSARRLNPRWNQTHEVDPVILIPPDAAVTEITLDAASTDFQVARGSVMTDEDGARQGTLLFPPGVLATMRHADGGEQLISDLHVRITEFTVGPEGPDSMPASLPANTGYTYAFEVNADEAVAAGAPEITFSEPLPYYVDNFIGFPVGAVVPVGAYEREQAIWIPHDNGVVIEVLGANGGIADVDLTGNGVPASPSELAAAGFSEGELTQLAQLYDPGARLWRLRLDHFTDPYDVNWPFHFPGDAEHPNGGDPDEGAPDVEGGCEVGNASTLECQTQVYKEAIPLAGSPIRLNYSSARFPGRIASRQIEIPLAGDTVPPSLKRIDASVSVAGRTFRNSFPPVPGTTWVFTWDGLDAYGQLLQSTQRAQVEVSFVFDGVYGRASRFNDPGLGHFPPGLSGDRTRGELFATEKWVLPIGASLFQSAGLGGWSLDVHHSYDPATKQLTLGDGSRITAAVMSPIIKNLAPSNVYGLASAADGSIYYCDRGWEIRRVSPAGDVSVIAGQFNSRGYSGDGGPAIDALVSCYSGPVAVGQDGSIYFGSYGDPGYRVRKIDPSGVITTVAGTGVAGYGGDGGLAIDAQVGDVWGLDVSPDGTLYIAEEDGSRGGHLRAVAPDGKISTVFSADNVRDVEIHPYSGDVHILVGTNRVQVYRLGADGEPKRIIGCGDGTSCLSGDYAVIEVPALNASLYAVSPPGRLGFGPAGELYLRATTVNFHGTAGGQHTWRLDSDGILRPYLSPIFLREPYQDQWPPELLRISPYDVAFAPDGLLLSWGGGVYKISAAFPGLNAEDPSVPPSGTPPYSGLDIQDIAISSPTGEEIFVFDPAGRHKSTLHAATSAILRSFEYDEAGLLTTITDSFGLTTTVERDTDGQPQSVVAPYGQTTEISLNADGYLEQVSLPGARSYSMIYGAGGLLSEFQDPTGGSSLMEYDSEGRITVDTDREEASLSLTRSELADGWAVQKQSAQGQLTTYSIEEQAGGGQSRLNTFPDGTSASEQWSTFGALVVLADGTQIETSLTGDPRFGMASPLSSSTTVLPSGLSRSVATTRTVNLEDPDLPGSLTRQTDRTVVNGRTYRREFYRSNLRIQNVNPSGRTTEEFIDPFGRTTTLRAPGGPTIRTQYAADKVAAIIIDPDGTPGNGNERTTAMTYDSSGRLESVTDPLTNATLFTNYDEADRPANITLPDSSQVSMTYDVEGNVASVTPPGKSPHNMTYGIWGRIESYTPPVGNAVTYEYDLDRHVDLIDFGPDALGQPNQVDFLWDNPTGQLTSITSPTGTIDVGYTQGKMTSLTSPSLAGPITTNIDYDGPLPTSLGWSGPVAGQVNWTYNDRFLIETETIGALPETTVTYQYDNDGLVTKAGDLTIARDAASGRVTSKTIGNIRERFQYNEFAELSRQTVELMNGTTVVETLYDVIYDDNGVNGDRDALGRITKKTERIVQGDTPGAEPRPLASRTYDYGYNPDGRPWLESVAVDGSVVSSYGYDANGNRTSAELSWSQLGYDSSFDVSLSEADTEYNDADQLLTYGDTTYEWNNFGQLASKTDTSTGEVTFYEYDLYGNLLSVALPDGRTIEYDVDGAGRRVGRRVLDDQGTEIEYRGWIYRDLLRPIAEVDAAGNVVVRYVYEDPVGVEQNGVDQIATRLGADQNSEVPFAGSNVPNLVEELDPSGEVLRTLFVVTNQVGSVLLAVNSSTGEISQRMEYDDFGRVVFDSNPAAQPFAFAGGIVDPEAGLCRFGARDYDPELGRWTSRDPIRAPLQHDGANAYRYSLNDPIRWTDPTGLLPSGTSECVSRCVDRWLDCRRAGGARSECDDNIGPPADRAPPGTTGDGRRSPYARCKVRCGEAEPDPDPFDPTKDPVCGVGP